MDRVPSPSVSIWFPTIKKVWKTDARLIMILGMIFGY